MKKISTLFKKNPDDLGLVINEVNPENEWVLKGEGIATRKWDGIATEIMGGEIFRRYDVKKGRTAPVGAIPCQEPDEITGHHPHWVKCDRNNPADKYFFIAFDKLVDKVDGTYELISDNFQGRHSKKNPENISGHCLIKHGTETFELPDLSFEGIKSFICDPENDIEGIVFHHKTDGRMCKIKKSNYGVLRHKI
jgi:hypothetical protein